MDLLQYFSAKLSAQLEQVYLLEIGAFNGKSSLYPLIQLFKWQGMLVEPVPDYFSLLQTNFPSNEGLNFINAAISDTRGHLPFYRIDPKCIQTYQLPGWVKKISSLSREHVASHDSFCRGVSKHILETAVDVITLDDLLQRHPLPRIDVLQIDAEGQDYAVLRQFDFTKYQPFIIHFEHARLPQQEQWAAMQLFLKHNYFIKIVHLKILALHPKIFKVI
jgi:FkbM family methyltransferase